MVRVADGLAYVKLSPLGDISVHIAEIKRELADFLIRARDDDRIKVVAITGKERTFLVGADLKAHCSKNPATDYNGSDEELDLSGLIRELGKPVVAAVNGYAVGAGMQLALACDVVIAGESAKFCEVSVGGEQEEDMEMPESKRIFNRAMSANRIFLMNRRYGAEEAYQSGLVNRVVRDDDLVDEMFDVAVALAK